MNKVAITSGESKKDKKYRLFRFFISTIISILVTYFTVTWAFYKQKNEGKYLAFEITSLYCYNLVNNGMDLPKGLYKSSSLDKELYLNMLKKIEIQFSSLVSNPYYVDLIKNYPDILPLKLMTSNEIIKLEHIENLETTGECHLKYFDLYDKVKKDMPKRFFKNDGKYFKLDKDVDSLRSEINKKIQENKLKKLVL